MTALDPTHISPGAHLLPAEARSIGRVMERKGFFFQNFIHM
jgi:hypothetical protein